MSNSYEAKQEARRARLARAAERAREDAERRLARADQMSDLMNGQPILIGHHSEKRHRRDIAKRDNLTRTGFAELKESEELARRADAVGTGGISSDDPDAGAKLDDKVATLERERDHMKRVNALYRKGDAAGLAAIGLDLEALRAKVAAVGYSWVNQPYEKWQISNLGARIRDAKKRSAEVGAVAARRDDAPVEELYLDAAGEKFAVVRTDPAENRVTVAFAARLSRDDYKKVRSYGFVWSPTREAFVRKLSPGAIAYARHLVAQLGARPSTVTEGSPNA